MIYEWHITCPHAEAEQVSAACAKMKGVKYSAIVGDPIMGPATFCYATGHAFDLSKATADLQNVAMFMRNEKITVLREKIELIVYDSRSK